MRKSLYTVKWNLDNNDAVYYNTLSGETVYLTKSVGNLSLETKEILIKKNIFTNLSVSEEIHFCKKYLQKKAKENLLKITLLTTYDCNLTCVYCIQNKEKRSNLTKKCVSDIVKWIVNLDKKHKFDQIEVTFSGGESLLNLGAIIEFVNLFKLTNNSKISYGLISNGTLLNEKNCKLLIDNRINKVMVSVDGPKEIHDQRRKWLSKESVFDTIMENIKIAQRFQMDIKLNVKLDKMNVNYIQNLWEYIEQYGFLKPIDISYGFIGRTIMNHSHCLIHSFNHYDMGIHYREMWKKIFQLKIPYRVELGAGTCPWERNWTVVIDPLGNLYKCISCSGSENGTVGNIYSNEGIPVMEKKINPECKSCLYFPLCRGGCYFEKDILKLESCKKKYFNNSLQIFKDMALFRRSDTL